MLEDVVCERMVWATVNGWGGFSLAQATEEEVEDKLVDFGHIMVENRNHE